MNTPVEVPAEPVYYYECSRGEFRLLYFIPTEYMERLFERSEQVLRDYPDGVDLTCTQAQFKEFIDAYGFRVQHDPDELRKAFFAIWTSTKDWPTGTHAGFLPANVIEEQLPQISDMVRSVEALESIRPNRTEASIENRRIFQKNLEENEKQVELRMRNYQSKGVNSNLSIADQNFGEIRMEKGTPVEEAFIRLSQQKEDR